MPHKRLKRSLRDAAASEKGYNLPPSGSRKDDTPRSALRILNSMKTQADFRSQGRKSSEDTGERKKRRKVHPGTTGGHEDRKHGPSKSTSRAVDGRGHGAGPSTDRSKSQPAANGTDGLSKGKGRSDEVAKPKIMPHETLGDYNRRVESLYRPEVSKAIKSASATRKAQVEALKKGKGKAQTANTGIEDDQIVQDQGGHEDSGEVTGKQGKKRKAEFDPAPKPRRLNDIVQAPPNLSFTKQSSKSSSSNTKDGGQSGGRLKRKAGDDKTTVWEAQGKGKSGLSAAQERILNEERERVIKSYREMKAARENRRVGEVGSHAS